MGEDWILLREKADKLLSNKVTKQFGNKWKKALLPVLDKFIDAYNGDICCVFWNSMIKRGYKYTQGFGSGGGDSRTWYTGWFNVLFPYLSVQGNFVENTFCVPYSLQAEYVCNGVQKTGEHGNDPEDYPIGLSSAPVLWEYISDGIHPTQTLELKFISGIIGYEQDPVSLEISSKMGWLIAHKEQEKK